MCGRFTLTASGEELARQFELDAEVELEARFNIAPSQDVASIRAEPGGARWLSFQRWGLIPAWASDPAIGNRLINARSETVATKPAFREALSSRRCIVPADGFYEWSRGGAAHGPHWIRPRSSRLIGIAGLWESWKTPRGNRIESCTLLTTEANALLRPIHDRMPVILDPEVYGRWLDPGDGDPGALMSLLAPCPADWLEARPVGPRVNDVKFDDARCLDPPAQRSLF